MLSNENRSYITKYINHRVNKSVAKLISDNRKLRKQNKGLIKRVTDIVHLKKHYFRHKMPYLKSRFKYHKILMLHVERVKMLNKLLCGIRQTYNNKEKKYLVKLSANNIHRLNSLLKYNLLRLPRPHKNKYYPQFNMTDLTNLYNFMRRIKRK